MPELISIIIPVYNSEEYLPRCLEAVAAQTYDNLEIILVDDGSTDGSSRICADFAAKDGRARIIRQENQGLWAARNMGQDAAKGAYLFFPDSDDYFHKDILRLLYEAINCGPGYDLSIVGRKITWCTDENITSPITPVLTEWSQRRLLETLLAEKGDPCCVYMWNKPFRRSLIDDLRTQHYLRAEDLDFNIRSFLRLDKAIVIRNELYFWLKHEGSLTRAPEALDIDYECRTDIFYRNAIALSGANIQYRPLLLRKLYRRMVFWKHRKWNSPDRASVTKTCRQYTKDTWKAFLFCPGIPLYEKIGLLTLLSYPRLAHRILKASGN